MTPGCPSPATAVDKVNASHVYGGAALQAQTLGNAVGVEVPYAIDTNFDGFIGMVNDMGGLAGQRARAHERRLLGRGLPARPDRR